MLISLPWNLPGPRWRWRMLSRSVSETWAARAAFAAQKLGDVAGVTDYGCGWMTLERYLPSGTQYVPVDLVARDRRTIICDFNVDPLPRTGTDAAACLGLIGYLSDPASFMTQLANRHVRVFVTYRATDAGGAPPDRRQAGLKSKWSAAQAERMFEAAGWRIEEAFWGVSTAQVMWILTVR